MTQARWRKSSYSGNQGNCVELPATLDAVRDSKNDAVLPLHRNAVTGLLAAMRGSRRG